MHIPVLQNEVIEYLNPKPNENFIDCTVGNAGHTLAILERNGPRGKILGIDADLEQIENCKLKIENFKKRMVLVCNNFINLSEIIKKEKFGPVNGILFDLGMSSWHLEQSGRGFSFLKNEPLDMRYNCKTKNNILTAKEIVNSWPTEEIEKILKEYGEEKFAKKIALKIIENRKIKAIESTFQLVEIIKAAVPLWYQHKRIHFATKTFQALRIAVNNELNNLKTALLQALDILEPEGRLVVISFHSLEDRIVKHFFKNKKKILKILTKKPIKPSKEEIKINPRSRSAKLRAIIKNYEN
jgi:16S rRNA (cytosine1402-N4)-methyltransferase